MEDTNKIKHLTDNLTRNVKKGVRNVLGTEEILHESEIHANQLTASVMLLSIFLLIATVILNEIGIYTMERGFLYRISISSIVALLIPWYLSIHYHYDKEWLKYLSLFSITLVYAAIDSMLTYRVIMIMAIPVIISSRYYSRKLTIFISLLSVLVFGISASVGIRYGIPDLNYLNIPKGTELMVKDGLLRTIQDLNLDMAVQEKILLLRNYMPKLFSYSIIALISVQVAGRGKEMVEGQDKISREHSRVETELGVARAIQEHALPIVHTLEDHPEFDLAASMTPAKEIGGDFYDFFFIDPTHLALMIADVSGKGVPAALFMMVSKIYLDNNITPKASPGQILAEVNHHICEKDLENMFVTVWLGILDLETGKLVSASAGHEYPIVCRKDAGFELFKDKHGLVLGGMDGVRYRETEIQLQPGDTLFVYTDGVPDTTNTVQECFGIERTLHALNKFQEGSMSELISHIKKELASFSGNEPQFDDTTMMAFRFLEYKSLDGISIKPDASSVEYVENYLSDEMEKAGLDRKVMNKVNICIDEIYPNIVNYSGAVWANASVQIDEKKVTVTFMDNGIPFNPLATAEPDTSLSLEDRVPGGLGIFMTKKLMDETVYQYIDGKNVFHMSKNLT